MFKKLILLVFCVINMTVFSQEKVKVTGVIYNEYLEPFADALVSSGLETVFSNSEGEFTVTINNNLPQILKITSEGYTDEVIEVTSLEDSTNVILKERSVIDQVIVSASRIPERFIEAPATIERMSLKDIKSNSANNSYAGLANLKGLSVNNFSYVYNSVNTRGFSGFDNKRFIQLIDGVDTALPSLSYSLSNIIGQSDLDIQSIEVLHGASSALYGANAYNGLMLIRTKSPFDYGGISAQFKTGIARQETEGSNSFYDTSVRVAYKFDENFAAKVNFGHIIANEWNANDYRNIEHDTYQVIEGGDELLGYNGVNVYGNDYADRINKRSLHRTGYKEKYLLKDNKIKNLSFSSEFHIRPLATKSFEVILGTKFFKVNNIIQGAQRYALRDFSFKQNKIELKGDNFFLRSYLNKNDMGDSYSLEETGSALSKKVDMDTWKNEILSYFNDNGIDSANFSSDEFKKARDHADKIRLIPGTYNFNKSLNNIVSNNIGDKGSRLYDKSSYWNTDWNYNFTSLINNWADIQLGGSYRKYNLDSKGTIFNDLNKEISVNEYGAYSQIQKKLFEDRLKVTGSLRYDKSTNFDGSFSPRAAVIYLLGDNKNHILRASYQTGFRNPTIKEQYVYIRSGFGHLIGSASDNIESVKGANRMFENGILAKAYHRKEYSKMAGGRIIKSEYKNVKPEHVKTFELGYKSLVSLNEASNLYVDLNGFYSKHGNFIFHEDIYVFARGTINPDMTYGEYEAKLKELKAQGVESSWLEEYQKIATIGDKVVLDWEAFKGKKNRKKSKTYTLITNAKSEVSSYGFGLSLKTKVFKDLEVLANYSFIDYYSNNKDLAFEPNFNTPKHNVKVTIGYDNVYNNFGFNLNYRWQDKYKWKSIMGTAEVKQRSLIDGQINYSVPSLKSIFKVGGTNLFGKDYQVAPGAGNIGQSYYFSWVINN